MERTQADYLCGQKKEDEFHHFKENAPPIEWENREEKTEYPSNQE